MQTKSCSWIPTKHVRASTRHLFLSRSARFLLPLRLIPFLPLYKTFKETLTNDSRRYPRHIQRAIRNARNIYLCLQIANRRSRQYEPLQLHNERRPTTHARDLHLHASTNVTFHNIPRTSSKGLCQRAQPTKHYHAFTLNSILRLSIPNSYRYLFPNDFQGQRRTCNVKIKSNCTNRLRDLCRLRCSSSTAQHNRLLSLKGNLFRLCSRFLLTVCRA